MDTPTASRPSRLPLRTALIALVATLALAGCSSSDSTSEASTSTVPASEEAATNDVVASSDVSITLDIAQNDIVELLSTGSSVVVAREVQGSDGQVGQLVWLSIDDLMETNEIDFDPTDMQVFASNTELQVGAMIEELASTQVGAGQMATWNDGQFDVTSASGDAVSVMSESDDAVVFGLAAPADVNGSTINAPYVAANVVQNEMVEFTDTGRIVVWVSSTPSQSGMVMGPAPSNSTTIDTSSQPNASLSFNGQTQTFVQNP